MSIPNAISKGRTRYLVIFFSLFLVLTSHFQGVLLKYFVILPTLGGFWGVCVTFFMAIFLSYCSKNSIKGLSAHNLILSGIIVGAILSTDMNLNTIIETIKIDNGEDITIAGLDTGGSSLYELCLKK